MREPVLDRREPPVRPPAASPARSGKHHSPPQMPRDGRRSSSTAPPGAGPARSLRLCGSSRRARCAGQLRRCDPSSRADARAATGQRSQSACARVQMTRAEIHHPLRVRFDLPLRQLAFRERPQLGLVCDAEIAREHALDVAVEDRGALADRRTRRSPPPSNARLRAARRSRPRAREARRGGDLLRRAMQVARTRVVTEAAPERSTCRRSRAQASAHRGSGAMKRS